jgi:hypothetical protein
VKFGKGHVAEAFMRVPAGGGLASLTGGGVVLSRSSGGSRIKICKQLQIPILDYGPRADCWPDAMLCKNPAPGDAPGAGWLWRRPRPTSWGSYLMGMMPARDTPPAIKSLRETSP